MGRWEYKAIKFKAEGWFIGGKVNAGVLESALNRMADDGWRLVTIVTSSVGRGTTEDTVAVMERERPAELGAAADRAGTG
jgi:Domain of unknown function (DUF4177)